jgi:hypothetical protein
VRRLCQPSARQGWRCVISNPDECWYTVTVTFPSGSDVSDITTWDATIVGDPVRLIK